MEVKLMSDDNDDKLHMTKKLPSTIFRHKLIKHFYVF